MSLEIELRQTIERIKTLRTELNRLKGRQFESTLLPPARPEDIEMVEQEFGIRLPPDFTTFLSSHNGWQRFNGQNDLLSTGQMRGGPMRQAIDDMKQIQRNAGDRAAQGFVIEASLSDTDMAFFDLSSQRPEGAFDVVRWDNREYKRYPGFLQYLVGFGDTLARRIEKERRRLR